MRPPDARPLCPDAIGAAIVLGVLAGAWLGWWAADLAAAWLWP